MKRQKGSVTFLLIILLLVIVAFFVFFTKASTGKGSDPATDDLYSRTVLDNISGQDVGNTQDDGDTQSLVVTKFENAKLGFTLDYPTKLIMTETSNGLSLIHTVSYKSSGCDMIGDDSSLSNLDDLKDFNLIMNIFNKPLVETVKSESAYIPEENFVDGKLVKNPGFIDEYEQGNLKGYSIYEGAEGCGFMRYYFPISKDRTLSIQNGLVQDFSGTVTKERQDKLRSVPGIIIPEESVRIFEGILKSIKFI